MRPTRARHMYTENMVNSCWWSVRCAKNDKMTHYQTSFDLTVRNLCDFVVYCQSDDIILL